MRIIKIVVLLSILAATSSAQNNTDILAKIGNKVLTVEEFRYRYEMTPQINRKNSDDGKAGEEFLYTIIAEKLFALEAEEKGFDTLKVMQTTYRSLEKMYVRDALYQKEIKDSVEFDNDKFTEGMKLSSFKLFLDYIYSEDEEKIKAAYSELQTYANFDSLAPLLKDVEYEKEPYEVIYGKMFPEPERAVYDLTMGEFTNPLRSPDGWYIFRLYSKIPVNYANSNQKISTVKKVIKGRTEDSIYNNFWNSFFKKKNANTDGILFWYLAENLQEVVIKVKAKLKIADNEKITIANEDFIYLKNKLNPDSLNKSFIKFDKNPISLENFINDFMFEGFYTFTTDLNTIAGQLQSRVKRQIELELLARYGYEKGFESLPEVKSSTEIWKDNYLSTIYLKDFAVNSKLTQEDLKDYLRKTSTKNFSETKYKIIEILTDSLEVVKEALYIINNDSLLKNFASKHTKRESVKNNKGEFDYFTISEFEEIGKVAESMEVGDVYGPLQTKEGYSVFKLIDKKESNLPIGNSVIDQDVKNKIQYNKIISDLENKAAEYAAKYNVTINEDLLKSLNLQNAQMIVFRYMGFGGRILAFPYSSPFYKWKEKWEQKKKDLL